MLGIEIELLTGRYTAQSGGHGNSEWPPHPSRFYSALVAAYHWNSLGEKEREALKWLEKRSAPDIYASEAYERDTVRVFVPENDARYVTGETEDRLNQESGGELSGHAVLKARGEVRKTRTFPTVVPEEPVVYYIWKEADSEELDYHRKGLENLVTSVPYLGHSSSLIRANLVDDAPEPNYAPSKSGNVKVRVPEEGRLEELERAYENRNRPAPVTPLRYGKSFTEEEEEIVSSNWSSNPVILQATNRVRLPLELTLDLTTRVRNAIIASADEPVPEYISGHTQEGEPSEREHIAYFPLSNVSYKWSDGAIQGFAVAFPTNLAESEQRKVLKAVQKLDKIGVGSRGTMELERMGIPKKASLKLSPYIEPSRVWITVTPYIFDRFPSNTETEEEIIKKSCNFIGVPQPTRIRILESGVNPLVGVPKDSDFRIPSEKFENKPWRHLIIKFENPVKGPILLGKGRYYGFGLMRSWEALEEP